MRYIIFGVIMALVIGAVAVGGRALLWSHYEPYDISQDIEQPFLKAVKAKYPDINLVVKNESFAESGLRIHRVTSPELFFGVFNPKEPLTVFVEGSYSSYPAECQSGEAWCVMAHVIYAAPFSDGNLVIYREGFRPPTTDKNLQGVKSNESLDHLIWHYDNKDDLTTITVVGLYMIGGPGLGLIVGIIFLLATAPRSRRTRSVPK